MPIQSFQSTRINAEKTGALRYHALQTYAMLFLFPLLIKNGLRFAAGLSALFQKIAKVGLHALAKHSFCFANLVSKLENKMQFNVFRYKARSIIPLLFLIFILLLSEIVAIAAASNTLSIKLSSNIRSAYSSFTLSEVADIEGPKDVSRIAGMLRFSVPATKILLREEVIKALQKSGITDTRIELRMPPEVSVEIVGSVGQTGGISIEEGRNLSGMVKKLSNWKYDVDVVPQGQIPQGTLSAPASIVPGSASVILKFRDNRGNERSLPARLTWYQPALVFKRSMNRGEIVRAEDIGERTIKIIAPNVYASTPDEVTGKSLRKSQQQGELILLSLVANTPIIQKGKTVTLFINVGGVMIESRGEAQQSGSIGDTISVKNLSSKKIISGIIRTPERVEVLK